MNLPRGLAAGTGAALLVTWALYAVDPGRGTVAPLVQSGVYVGLAVLTARSRRAKVLLVRALQRHVVNPIVRALLACGLNPLGLALLETRGRRTGATRRVPVGNGRVGEDFWVIAEHGLRAGYVRNVVADPRVRVRLRVGLRYRWLPGLASVHPELDPLAVQRRLVRWHPLRALNAMNVRVLGADLVVVRVRLQSGDGGIRDEGHRPEPVTMHDGAPSGTRRNS